MPTLPTNIFCWGALPMCGNLPVAFAVAALYTIFNHMRDSLEQGVFPMVPITVEKFADMVMKNNEGYNRKELIKTLQASLDAKKYAAKCVICGQLIWAAGSAITGIDICFTCTTGEADDSENYEIM